MSNYLAIAATTATFSRILTNAIQAVPSLSATPELRIGRPPLDPSFVGANLFLYRAAPSPVCLNDDLARRNPNGDVAHRSQLALDLDYVISFYGSDLGLEPHRLMGSVIALLHANPIVPTADIRAAIMSAASLWQAPTSTSRSSPFASRSTRSTSTTSTGRGRCSALCRSPCRSPIRARPSCSMLRCQAPRGCRQHDHEGFSSQRMRLTDAFALAISHVVLARGGESWLRSCVFSDLVRDTAHGRKRWQGSLGWSRLVSHRHHWWRSPR
jgi:Pvc16 N-terminal domain